MRTLLRTLTIVAIACIAQAADDVRFEQSYTPGKRYRQTVTIEQEMTADTGLQKVENKMMTQMGMVATVAKHEDGTSKRVSVMYDRAAASLSADGQKFSFDSKAPEAANAGPLAALARVVGQEFRVIFSADDQVKDVENLDRTVQALSSGDAAGSQLHQQLFSKDAVKRMMHHSVLRGPKGKTVKAGDSWPFTQDMDLPGIGKLIIKGFYTFDKMAEHGGVQCAEVKAKAEITIDTSATGGAPDDTQNRMREMQMRVEDGRMEGTYIYDPAIQFTRSVNLTNTLTLTARIPDGSNKVLRLPMKQAIRMSLDGYEDVPAAKPVPAK